MLKSIILLKPIVTVEMYKPIIPKIAILRWVVQSSSFISTPASDFVVSGNWTLRVEGGNLSGFNANMTWFPTNVTAPNIQAHGHSFSNFIADPTNEKIVLLGPDNTLGAKQTYSINGVMDVGANQNQTKWPSVPANIKLGGKTITISLDDSKTDGHFNNYPVFGQIAKLEMNQVLSQSAPKQPGTQSQQTNQISEQKDNLKLDIILQFSNKAVIASNEGDDTGVKENLLKLQEYLKESAGNKVMSMPANEIGTQSQQTNQISEQKDNLKLDIILQFSNKAVIASNEGDDTGVKENLLKLQEYLKESAGNKVMSMPANEIFSE